VHKRLELLREQRRSIETTIAELEDIERQAWAVLETKVPAK
jgi:hypothetical protein